MEVFKELLKDILEGNFSGLVKLVLFVIGIICPSYLLIFVFKRQLFYSMDFMKLLLLCISLNCIIIFIGYVVTYIFFVFLFYIAIKNKSLNFLGKQIKKGLNKLDVNYILKNEELKILEFSEISKFATNKTIQSISFVIALFYNALMIIMISVVYLANLFYKFPLNYEKFIYSIIRSYIMGIFFIITCIFMIFLMYRIKKHVIIKKLK